MASTLVDQILATPWWPEFLRIKDTLTWAALGERFGVQSQNLARALEAVGGTKVSMPRGRKPRGAAAPEASEPVEPTPEDILATRAGKAPDVEVAAAAGVAVDVVKQFRRDRGIAGYLRPPPDGFVPALRTLSVDQPVRKPTGVVVRRTAGEDAHEVRVETRPEPPVATAAVATVPAEPVAPHRGKEAKLVADLEAFRSELGKVGDQVIAELAGVSRGTVGDYRRKLGIAAYDGFRWEKGKPKPAARPKAQVIAAVAAPALPAEPAAARGRRGPISAIDAFAEMLGKVPDSVIAGLAGVRTDTVKQHRVRRGVQAVGALKEQAAGSPPEPLEVEAVPAEPAPTPTPVTHPVDSPPTESPTRRTGSKIEPVVSVPGVEPDQPVAEEARLTISPTAEPEPPPMTAPPAVTIERVAAPAPASRIEAEPEPPAAMGYRVRAVSGERERDFLVVADDIADAAVKAKEALSRRSDGPWRAAMIRELLEALK